MRALTGELRVPGDKSISHRALILASMASGLSIIQGLSDAEDVRSTWHCLQELGVRIFSKGDCVYVDGLGWRGLQEPKKELDCGNSGTTMRLLMGVIAGNDIWVTLSGDDSLRRRPMERVAAPLRLMGAAIETQAGGRAPVRVRGAALGGMKYESPVASAQVKSAVLLAGLLAVGETTVTEPAPSRDHTERMLPLFGAKVKREGLSTTVQGALPLARANLRVPGDASSAAFWTVAALLVPGSELKLRRVGLNPTRIAFLEVLRSMGAELSVKAGRSTTAPDAEPTGDIVAKHSALRAAAIEPGQVPALIDEIPILALAATQAEGVSRFKGLSELRHKESDRLAGISKLLNDLGADTKVERDDLVISGPTRLHGGKVSSLKDHRLAMTAKIAGFIAEGAIVVDDEKCIGISYPGFLDQWRRVRG
jgi:3-phosphoshikimate 1-carboxyvinyltransferase